MGILFGKLAKMRIYSLKDGKINTAPGKGLLGDKLSKLTANNKIASIGAGLAQNALSNELGAIDDLATGVVDNIKNLTGIDLIKDATKGYEVMFNPETYSEKHLVHYKQQIADGKPYGKPEYSMSNPKEYTFDFIIDGTGAAGTKREVNSDVEKFLSVVGYEGEKHEPNVLGISWGTLFSTVVLKSADIAYTLFDSSGVPLRAKITASFCESIPLEEVEKKIKNASPDLTKVRTVLAGDNLPLMVEQEYGDPSLYLEIARINNLTNFRNLEPGTTLVFPPIEK